MTTLCLLRDVLAVIGHVFPSHLFHQVETVQLAKKSKMPLVVKEEAQTGAQKGGMQQFQQWVYQHILTPNTSNIDTWSGPLCITF